MYHMQKLIVFLILGFLSLPIAGQWQQLEKPEGGRLEAIINVGTKLFISADRGGLYSSTNNGESWNAIQNDLPIGYDVVSFFEANGTLFLQTETIGKNLYISTDIGETWVNTNLTFDQSLQVTGIATDGSKLFLSVETGLYISVDGGINWNFKPYSQIDGFTFDLLFFDNKLYRAAFTKIYVTDNEGTSWSEVPFDAGPNGIRHLFVHNDRVFISNNSRIYSTDNFETFEYRYYDRFGSNSIKSFDNIIYITNSNGEYRYSSDNGVTWTTVVVDSIGRPLSDIYKIGSKIIVSGNAGLVESVDNGVSWVANNSGVLASSTTAVSSNGTEWISSMAGIGIIKSENSGVSWTTLNGNLPEEVLRVNSFSSVQFVGNNIVAKYGKKIYVSTDNGLTYNNSYEVGPLTSIGSLSFDGNRLFAFLSSSEIIISEDMGVTWVKHDFGFETSSSIYNSPVLQGNTIVGIGNANSLIISNDYGVTWLEKQLDIGSVGNDRIRSIEFYDNKLYILTVNNFYESSLTGDDLKENIAGNLGSTIYDFNIFESKVYFFGNYLSVSTIGGNLKYDISQNLENRFVSGIALIDNELVFSTLGYGFWKGPVQEVPADSDNDGIRDSVDICSNTPVSETANEVGCSFSQRDDDQDGVLNPYDECGTTPLNLEVNDNGCAMSELDSDRDGITDDIDQCSSNIPHNGEVNEVGCDFIPNDAVTVFVRSASCPGSSNGLIEIHSTYFQNLEVKIDMPDGTIESYEVRSATSPLQLENLNAGNYSIHVSRFSADYNKTYLTTVTEFEGISGKKGNFNSKLNNIVYTVSGSKSYSVRVNNVTTKFNVPSTNSEIITVPLSNGQNHISITGENACQGKIIETIVTNNDLTFYPTITNDKLTFINVDQDVSIQIYTIVGRKILEEKLDSNGAISVGHLDNGMYVIQINAMNYTSKFVKN